MQETGLAEVSKQRDACGRMFLTRSLPRGKLDIKSRKEDHRLRILRQNPG
jgi:hypothetical protein